MTDWKGLVDQAYNNKKRGENRLEDDSKLRNKKRNEIRESIIRPAFRDFIEILNSKDDWKQNFMDFDQENPCIGAGSSSSYPKWKFTILMSDADFNPNILVCKIENNVTLDSYNDTIQPVTKEEILNKIAYLLNKIFPHSYTPKKPLA